MLLETLPAFGTEIERHDVIERSDMICQRLQNAACIRDENSFEWFVLSGM